MPYQLVGVRELVSRDSLLLADDMGLGKSTMSLAAIRILVRQRRITSALVVVPAGLISQWRVEARRWAPELRVSSVHGAQSDRGWQWRTPAHVYLTSYETLRADFSDNPHAPAARLWDLVVLDEAQRIKNAATDVARTCKRLRRKRQWAITGTPLENSPEDLISIPNWSATSSCRSPCASARATSGRSARGSATSRNWARRCARSTSST
jgi:SNF2 family DNA or RNA helicase